MKKLDKKQVRVDKDPDDVNKHLCIPEPDASEKYKVQKRKPSDPNWLNQFKS